MKQKPIQSIFILLCLVCLTVIGCSNNKGGMPMMMDEAMIDPKPSSPIIGDPTTVLPIDKPLGVVGMPGTLGNRPEVAAQAIPSQGSVFQSSEQGTLTVMHQDSPQDWKVSTNQVGEYVPFYKFTYVGGSGGSVLDETEWIMQDGSTPNGNIGYSSSSGPANIEHCPWSDCINKPAIGRHDVDSWSTFNLKENRADGSSTFVKYFSDFQKSPEDDPDTDYMLFGYWSHVPKDAEYQNDSIVGVFADGGDPFAGERLNSLEGTATYVGDTGGVYRETQVGGESDGFLLRSTHFAGKATLNANFGHANAHIEGKITDLHFTDTGREDMSFVLAETSLSDFMTGDTTAAENGDTGWAGKWGAQFYGNGPCEGTASACYPSSIAGTFGATSTTNETQDDPGRTRTILGGFGAYLQPNQ